MASQEHTLGGEYNAGGEGGVELKNNLSSSSSTSSEESQTLQGDSPTQAHLSNGSPGVTSPISSPLDGGDLSVITGSRFWKTGGHFVSKNNAALEQTSPLATRDFPRPLRPRNGSGAGYGHGHGHSGNSFSGNGFRSSRTWVSPDQQHHQEFVIVRNAMRRLFKNSEVAKWKLQDYTAHKEGMIAAKQARLQRTLEQKELELELGAPMLDAAKYGYISEKLDSVGGHNLTMVGNLSRTLGMKTIWCQDWMNGKDEVAPWPSLAEMKWEGDDRAKTSCGRFLPLPREEGAPAIPWGQLQVVEQYKLDQVQCIPTMEDIYAPVDEIEDEEVIHMCLNQDVLDALDEDLL